jgi:hypothetical protein
MVSVTVGNFKERLGPLAVARPVALQKADHRVLVLFMDMELADGRYEPLLGYLTLEQCGIMVDMVGRRLANVPHLDLKSACRAA